MAHRRRLSAAQLRAGFGGRVRRTARTVRKVYSRRRALVSRGRRAVSRSSLGGWLPRSIGDTLMTAGAGAAVSLGTPYIQQYTDQYLQPWFGNYTPEVTAAGAAALIHNFSSGTVKELAGKAYDFAAASAGAKLASQLSGNTQFQ